MKRANFLAVSAAAALGVGLGLAVAAPPDRSKPPSMGSTRNLKLPPIQRSALSNGLPVLLMEAHEVPSVELMIVIKAGAVNDPPGQPGVASVTADMLDEGAGGKDALLLAEALESLGADLSTSATWDASIVRMHVPSARLKAALPLMADVILHPLFRAKDFERLRRNALTTLLQARDDPRQLASAALDRAVFGEGSRYGWPLAGAASSIAAIKLSDVRSFHGKYYRPTNAAFIAVGDVDASIVPLIEKALAPWSKGGAAPVGLPDAPQVHGRAVWVVDKPDAPQSVIRLGRVGPGRTTPDYHPLEVMNTILGGSFTSRLNDNLREQHGYAYGASSVFRYRHSSGLFVAAADVQTKSTADALKEALKELDRMRTPTPKDEIERARNYLALGYAQDFETTRQLASQVANLVVHGLPDEEFSTFVSKVQQVEAKDVQRVAGTYMGSDNLVVVVVGDRGKIEKSLKALDLGAFNVLTVDQVMGPAPKIE